MTTAELAVLLDLAAHAPRVQDQKFLLARLAEQGATERGRYGYRLTPSGRELVAELLRIATDHVSLYTALRRSLRRAGAKDRGVGVDIMTDRAATTLQKLAERVAALNPYPFHATVSLRAMREMRCAGGGVLDTKDGTCGLITTDNGTCPICGGPAIPEPNYRLAPWAIPSGADR